MVQQQCIDCAFTATEEPSAAARQGRRRGALPLPVRTIWRLPGDRAKRERAAQFSLWSSQMRRGRPATARRYKVRHSELYVDDLHGCNDCNENKRQQWSQGAGLCRRRTSLPINKDTAVVRKLRLFTYYTLAIMARRSAHARILAPLLLALLLLSSSASAETVPEDASSGGGGGGLGEATDAYTYIPAPANAPNATATTTTDTTAADDGDIADVDYENSTEQESVGVDATTTQNDDMWASISFLHRERRQTKRGRRNLRR